VKQEIWVDSVFRWAGSKRKLLPILMKNIPNDYGRYVEPFCGSACLFFAINPHRALLSDINNELIHAFKQIKRAPKKIAKAVSEIPVEKDIYNDIRKQKPDDLNAFDRAVRFTYLNRNCFNGVYRTNQKGEFNVPMGTRTGDVPDATRFSRCSQALKNATLVSRDFEAIVEEIQQNDFVYLDPPYAKKGYKGRGEYGPGAFQYEDIDRMLGFLQRIDKKDATFLFSYAYDEELIQRIPANWFWESLSVNRHVAGFSKHRGRVDEILVSNKRIQL
jgi:DNA adenine methylase